MLYHNKIDISPFFVRLKIKSLIYLNKKDIEIYPMINPASNWIRAWLMGAKK